MTISDDNQCPIGWSVDITYKYCYSIRLLHIIRAIVINSRLKGGAADVKIIKVVQPPAKETNLNYFVIYVYANLISVIFRGVIIPLRTKDTAVRKNVAVEVDRDVEPVYVQTWIDNFQ